MEQSSLQIQADEAIPTDRQHFPHTSAPSYEHIIPFPIQRCPPDILHTIFTFLVLDTFHNQPLCLKNADVKKWTTIRAPWNLAPVCKSWHNLVSTSPVLWSFIAFMIPSYSVLGEDLDVLEKSTETAFLSCLRKQIVRSPGVDLHIKFHCGWRRGDECDVPIEEIISFIPPHLPRCRSLDISGGLIPHLQLEDVLSHKLTQFRIHSNDPGESYFVGNCINLAFLKNAKNLKLVEGAAFFCGQGQPPALPWSQLTSVQLSAQITPDFLSALEELQDSVVSLSIYFFKPHGPLPLLSGRTFNFSNLHSLSLDGDSDSCRLILSIITTPKIDTSRILAEEMRAPNIYSPT